jgi:LmbE family N-acetylglucosaminyl deacetylase
VRGTQSFDDTGVDYSAVGSADVLVVSAHPDDAEIAVGGSIAAWTDAGKRVLVACLTVSDVGAEARQRRLAATERAAAILGHDVVWLGDGAWDQVEDVPEYVLVRHLDALFESARPDVVVTHWDGDSHADHVRCARAVVASTRRWPQTLVLQFGPAEHRTVRYREFVPTLVLSVAEHSDRKARALQEHAYAGTNFRAVDVAGESERARARGVLFDTGPVECLRLVQFTGEPEAVIRMVTATDRAGH